MIHSNVLDGYIKLRAGRWYITKLFSYTTLRIFSEIYEFRSFKDKLQSSGEDEQKETLANVEEFPQKISFIFKK